MKFIALTLIFVVFTVFSSHQEEISQFILNGETALIEDHPYMANVFTAGVHVCGGTILSTRSVLTAAHCLIARISQPFIVSVVVGSVYRNGRGGQSHRALRLFLHPEFIAGPFTSDVAIIRTSSQIRYNRFTQPIPLTTPEYLDVGVNGVFTGWGVYAYGPILTRRPDQLQKMYTTTISNEECRERYNVTHRGQYVVHESLCIVSISGSQTSMCQGDSGSPLMIDGKVAGIANWRTLPCGDGLPDVFVRVSEYLDWIQSVLL